MAENSKIEWCDHTFNPWIGCTKVGPGCDHCYADAWDQRFGGNGQPRRWGAGVERSRTSDANWRKPLAWQGKAAAFMASHGRRQRVFCASLADVFDNEVPQDWRADLFQLIQSTPDLDWLLVTKRVGRAGEVLRGIDPNWSAAPWRNVWLGATVVNQDEANRDIPKLLDTPAAVRFLSCEPLLGPLDLSKVLIPATGSPRSALGHLDWVIAGGESGTHARPMHPDWSRRLRDQCAAVGVSFFFKQWGEWRPPDACEDFDTLRGRAASPPAFLVDEIGNVHCTHEAAGGGALPMIRAGKKTAGRLLDGRTWNEWPAAASRTGV